MIYTITLNPAIDDLINIKGVLKSGINNRIIQRKNDVGGKGTHVSIILSLLKKNNIATGIVGEDGENILINLLNKYGVTCHFLTLPEKSTRRNIVLTDESATGSFMITENGISITNDILNKFDKYILQSLNSDDLVVVAGNPAKDTSDKVYRTFLNKIISTGAKLIIDTSGRYLVHSLDFPVECMKPNQYEYGELVNYEIKEPEDVVRYYDKNRFKNIRYLIVSLGKQGSVLIEKDNAPIFIKAPMVKTKNDTGSGDAFVGGLVYGISENWEITKILRFATGIAASKAMLETSSGFEQQIALELAEKVHIKRLGRK